MHRQLVVNYVNWPNAFGLVLINVCAGFGVASIFFVPNNCGICSFEFALIYLPVAIICILFYQSFFWHCCIFAVFFWQCHLIFYACCKSININQTAFVRCR